VGVNRWPGAAGDQARTYADSVRDYGHAVVIGFGHEMIARVRIFSDEPILLSETAVGPTAGVPFAEINNLFDGMRRYKTLGLVWFDIAQSGGILRQDWRIEDSRPASAAFRLGRLNADPGAALAVARGSRL
jgi:hypothetical protein